MAGMAGIAGIAGGAGGAIGAGETWDWFGADIVYV